MKRLLSFLILILLLVIAIISLRLWELHVRGGGAPGQGWHDLFHRGPAGFRRPEKYTIAEGPRINVNEVDVLAAMSRQRILLAKAVVPSVVSITTYRSMQGRDFGNDPLLQLFHQGMHQGGEVGSGAIVSREGHIVTNNHVIDQMDEIEVRLNDGRSLHATLIGTDPQTDIAVLKVDADHLQPLPFGDSDAVEVGETVMAVGNPYGLNESVSQGIISAKGRRGSENISDLLQTDAAINPGNSGGPLVNVRGELIGINEAIFSQSGGWQGVGFAVPSSTVRMTMDTILKTGRALHGYLGVLEPPGNSGGSQRGLGDAKGVTVDRVLAGSPAEKAGIQAGDFIQTFNHKAVDDFRDLRHSVGEVAVDTSVPIELLRDGKKISVSALIAERPPASQFSRQEQFLPPSTVPPVPRSSFDPHRNVPGTDATGLTGVQVSELAPPVLQQLDLPAETHGVLVRSVEPYSAAAEKLLPGDVIEQINQQPVGSLAEYAKLIRALPGHSEVSLSVLRERARVLVVLAGG